MRIWLDGSMAKGGGGFTYLVNIVPTLARLAPEDTFRLAISEPALVSSFDEMTDLPSNVEIEDLGPLGLKDRMRFTYLRAGRMAKAWGADIYYSAGELAPLDAGCPTIAAFRNPNVFALGKGQELTTKQKLRLYALNSLARLSALRCERVVFVSEDSAEWMGDSVSLPRERRAPIHHGIDPTPWRPTEKRSEDLDSGSYILSVSSVYPYKNFPRLIEAYAQVWNRHPNLPELVIIGDCQDAEASKHIQDTIEAVGEAGHHVRVLGEVPYAEIQRYYKEASLFVFPSHLETFGHPMIEAMAAELPLVAADTPIFREVGADAAFYADPFSVTAMASAIEAALFAPGAREALIKRGKERVKHFTWDRSAAELLKLLHETSGSDGRRRSHDKRNDHVSQDEVHDLRIAAHVADALAH